MIYLGILHAWINFMNIRLLGTYLNIHFQNTVFHLREYYNTAEQAGCIISIPGWNAALLLRQIGWEVTFLCTKCWAFLNSLWKISCTRCSGFVVDLTRTVSVEKCYATVMRRLKIPSLYSAKIQICNSRQVMQMEHCKLQGVHCCLEWRKIKGL